VEDVEDLLVPRRSLFSWGSAEKALNKGLALFLDSGRIRLCEASCGVFGALFRDSLNACFSFLVFLRDSWSLVVCVRNRLQDSNQSGLALSLFFVIVGSLKEALKKDLLLALDSGRIKLCEAPCEADAALFRGSLEKGGYVSLTILSAMTICTT
jgi:hypothetical protein